jgi:DNA-binding CsgD family transcriptional regulator
MKSTTQSRLYPGMVDTNVEFFKSAQGVKVISKGIIKKFNQLSPQVYQILKTSLSKEAHATQILNEWYPNNELQQLEKFTECRLGGLDFTPDIQGNVLQDGEYHDCPFRGKCAGEGIICKALKYNGKIISQQEIELLRLIATNYINEVIAEKLKISFGQFHKVKKALYSKLNVQTKQGATLIAFDLNLINRNYASA